MSPFWQTWRREIIRGTILFCGVITVGLFVRSIIGHVREGVANTLPMALRDLGDLRELRNLKDHFEVDPNIDPHAGPRDTAVDRWDYRGKLSPGKWLWIGNTNGSVTVEGGKSDSLEVVAVKTYRRSDPARVHIETASSAEGIAICALWVEGRGRCAPGGDFKPSSSRRNDVAVDFRVLLPRGVRLGATTVSGAVRVMRASAPLVITTVNGEVDAQTSAGPVRAVSVNGAVRARMSAFGDTGEVAIFTVNGSATAELPTRLDAEVEASTVNGAIMTDYPLQVTGKLGKRLQGTLGAGGRKVQIRTVNGAINLRKATQPS
jgi:putative adhesin